MVVRRRKLFPNFGKRLLPFVVMGIANGVFPWIAIAWGEERISSGLASILNATTPLWAAILVYWVVPSERPSLINYAGVLLGLAGVVILVLPDITAGGIRGDLIGTVAVLLTRLHLVCSGCPVSAAQAARDERFTRQTSASWASRPCASSRLPHPQSQACTSPCPRSPRSLHWESRGLESRAFSTTTCSTRSERSGVPA
jgi:hypothetical protein